MFLYVLGRLEGIVAQLPCDRVALPPRSLQERFLVHAFVVFKAKSHSNGEHGANSCAVAHIRSDGAPLTAGRPQCELEVIAEAHRSP